MNTLEIIGICGLIIVGLNFLLLVGMIISGIVNKKEPRPYSQQEIEEFDAWCKKQRESKNAE